MNTFNPFSAGYVLVTAGTQDVNEIRNSLNQIPGVKIAHPLIGPDDLICFVDAGDSTEFRHTLDKKIRKLVDEGTIEHTETMIVLGSDGYGYSGEENRPAPAAAWLLCDLSIGDPEIALKKLLDTPSVRNAHAVLGRYDVVAFLEANSIADLMTVLDSDIRHIKEIRRTDTRLVLMSVPDALPPRRRKLQAKLGPK